MSVRFAYHVCKPVDPPFHIGPKSPASKSATKRCAKSGCVRLMVSCDPFALSIQVLLEACPGSPLCTFVLWAKDKDLLSIARLDSAWYGCGYLNLGCTPCLLGSSGAVCPFPPKSSEHPCTSVCLVQDHSHSGSAGPRDRERGGNTCSVCLNHP